MNFRQMQYFAAVYEEGTFSKAALRENCTQSGLSQQIRKLEERLGVRLFERSRHGVAATMAGAEYYAHCIQILQSVNTAEQHMAELRGNVAGTVRAGLGPSLTKGVLASVLTAFTAEYPYVDFHIVETVSQPLTEQVISGELDFAIVPTMPDTGVPGLDQRVLAREQEILVSGPALGLADMVPVPLADMAGLKLVLPAPANSRRLYLDSQMAKAGVIPARMMDMDGMTGKLEFVAESDWATILPVTNCLGEQGRGRLILSPIIDPEIVYEFILIRPSRRPLNIAAKLFVAAIEERLATMATDWSSLVRRCREQGTA